MVNGRILYFVVWIAVIVAACEGIRSFATTRPTMMNRSLLSEISTRSSLFFNFISSITRRIKLRWSHFTPRSLQTQKSRMKLYAALPSPPSRSVIILLELMNIDYDFKFINIFKGDNLTPEFSKMNPQRTIPVLDDNGHIVSDSHAINAYLVNNYGTAAIKKLYPEDPKARSVIDQRLHYDTGVLFPAYIKFAKAYQLKRITGVTEEIVKEYEDIYRMTEELLSGHTFLAGDEYTIADISAYTSLTSMGIMWPANPEQFPILVSYLKTCETDIRALAGINGKGIDGLKQYVFEGFKSNQ